MPRKPLSKTDIESFRDRFCEVAYGLYVLEDYDAVTMRGIAKVLGCSPMMAYRYFDNKEEVFAALRAIRFNDLAQTLEAVPTTLSPAKYLRELGKAYAGFAHESPHAYRLLYLIPIHQEKTYPEVVLAQERTQRVLFDATRKLVGSGEIQGDPVLLAHTLWASIHGLVSLDLANQLTQGASFDQLFPGMLDCIINSS
ncbi:MAG: AcrR family transcriptional regulator [Halioglobus sp.]|jgi:AcrR family transcriptional regulator